MLSKEEYEKYKQKIINYINTAKIPTTVNEKNNIQVAEYGLNCIDQIGLELIEYVNTERCCAKQLVLLPNRTCPEHRHPPVSEEEGKEETFRCCYGKVYLYVPREPNDKISAVLPDGREDYFTCKHEIVLLPGEQYTNVNIGEVAETSKAYTTLAFVDISENGERSLSFARNLDADMCLKSEEVNYDIIKNSGILHIGSLSLTNEPASSATISALRFAR